MTRKHQPKKCIDGAGYPWNNGARAERAAGALEHYVGDDEQDPSHVGDLICDLMHYCDREKIDFDECLRNGVGCYSEESEHDVSHLLKEPIC